MTFAAILYFLLLIFWLIFGISWESDWRTRGGGMLQFVLFVIIGFALFGNVLVK